MLSKRMKVFMVLAFGVVVWAGFGADESVADKEPDFVISTEDLSENREDYKDEVVMTTGTITSMNYIDNGVSIVLDGDVNCFFKGDEADGASQLSIGELITVKGKGNGFNDFSTLAELNYCTLNI